MNLHEEINNVLIKGIFAEIIKVYEVGALSATVIMIYVAIDAMAFLATPLEQEKTSGIDFINWVNQYMKTDVMQSYQYDGKDMWAARCGKLHSYSSFSDYAQKKNCKLYGYYSKSEHRYEPQVSNELVIISVPKLVKDFGTALREFIRDILTNNDLKQRFIHRIGKICQQYEITNQ